MTWTNLFFGAAEIGDVRGGFSGLAPDLWTGSGLADWCRISGLVPQLRDLVQNDICLPHIYIYIYTYTVFLYICMIIYLYIYVQTKP